MFKIEECKNRYCPYRSLVSTDRCRCKGTGLIVSGTTNITRGGSRVRFSEAFRKRHRLTESTG